MQHVLETPVDEFRDPDNDIVPLLFRRWSPRAMSGETVTDDDLAKLFEAARWAPSSYNGQPWRFVYAKRDSSHWRDFFALLGEFNQEWTSSGAVLVIVLSRTTFEHNGKPARTHSFDTGAAWQNLALQGRRMDLVVHGMAGFDYQAAADLLQLPDDFEVEAMVVIGRPAKAEVLDDELQEKEAPSDRKPVSEIAFEGRLPHPDSG